MVVIDVFVAVAIAVVTRVTGVAIVIAVAALIVTAVGVAVAKVYYHSNCDNHSSIWGSSCYSTAKFAVAIAQQ